MKFYVLSLILFGSLLNASSDLTSQDKKLFMQGTYIEVREFSQLDFNSGVLTEESKNYFEALVTTIKSYIEDSKDIEIQVLGHSNARKNIYDKVVAGEKAYEKSLLDSKVFAQRIATNLENRKISKELISLAYKSSKALGFDSTTKDGRNISNRVVVTMYVRPAKIKTVQTNRTLLKKSLDVSVIEEDSIALVKKPLFLKQEPSAIVKVKKKEPLALVATEVKSVMKAVAPLDKDKDGVIDGLDLELYTPKGYLVNNVGRAVSVSFATDFDKKTVSLSESLNAKILKLASYLIRNTQVRSRIVGYTSRTDVSDRIYNIRLSLQRAKRIKLELEKYGIKDRRVLVDGKGFSSPIADNNTLEGRIKNRRVEIEFIRKKEK